MKPVIEARDVHFHYTAGAPVLKGITVFFAPGATAIIGENGAGKSTFVRLLNGLLKPTKGDVIVGGLNTKSATVATLARTVGLVFQNPSDQLFKSNVLDEVMFGPLNLQLSLDEARRRALDALELVGLDQTAGRNPYDLGLAERKLVTIAGVLAMDPPVIILDEPTIAQDEAGVRQIGTVVDNLRAAGRTVIAITHDMNFVARHFRRVLVFHEGRVLADSTAEDVFSRSDLLQTAGVEAPQIARFGRKIGLAKLTLTVESFVEQVNRR